MATAGGQVAAADARRLLEPALDDRDDRRERRPLLVGVDRERLADRPGVDRAVGNLAHHGAVGLHPLAVERRQHEATLLEVTGAVEDEERVIAEQAEEGGVASPARSRAGSAVKISRIASGWLKKTNGGFAGKRSSFKPAPA